MFRRSVNQIPTKSLTTCALITSPPSSSLLVSSSYKYYYDGRKWCSSSSSSSDSTSGGSLATGANSQQQQEKYFGSLSTGMRISAYSQASDEPLAVGKVTSRIADNVFVVTFDEVPRTSLVIELGSKVTAIPSSAAVSGGSGSGGKGGRGKKSEAPAAPTAEDGAVLKGTTDSPQDLPPQQLLADAKSGLVAKVHGDDSYAILFDDDKYEARIPRDRIMTSEGRPKFMTTDRFKNVRDWVGKAGVDKRSEKEATAAILFQRGWRKEKLYLLEHSDVHCLSHLNKSVRMSILEKADFERDRHRLEREINKDRLKEQTDWRYKLTRYTGVFSAVIGVCGAFSVFTWNYKRWVRETRDFAVHESAARLTQKRTLKARVMGLTLPRESEVNRLKDTLEAMDPAHPRIVALTGVRGSGKSVLMRSVANKMPKRPFLFVNVRGGKDDPFTAIVKAMEVTNIARCGDLVEFISDVFHEVRENAPRDARGHHTLPTICFKLHETALSQVHAAAIALACDKRICHVVIEIDAEDIDFETALKPRFDFFSVEEFSKTESIEYVERQVDHSALESYVELIGTNANSLDELIAIVNKCGPADVDQREWKARQYTSRRISRACREIRPKLQQGGRLAKLLEDVAAHDYDEGLPAGPWNKAGIEAAGLDKLLHYNHETQRWVFHSKELYTAVNALKGSPKLLDANKPRGGRPAGGSGRSSQEDVDPFTIASSSRAMKMFNAIF